MTTYIYILVCPFDNLVKYVGKSNNPETRLKDHMFDFRCMDLGKAQWIRRMKAAKKKPTLVVVDEIDLFDWKFWEEWWCAYMKSMGYKLYNKRSRNGLTYQNSKSFKKGHVPHNKKIK